MYLDEYILVYQMLVGAVFVHPKADPKIDEHNRLNFAAA
jgi:hypothetical protein